MYQCSNGLIECTVINAATKIVSPFLLALMLLSSGSQPLSSLSP